METDESSAESTNRDQESGEVKPEKDSVKLLMEITDDPPSTSSDKPKIKETVEVDKSTTEYPYKFMEDMDEIRYMCDKSKSGKKTRKFAWEMDSNSDKSVSISTTKRPRKVVSTDSEDSERHFEVHERDSQPTTSSVITKEVCFDELEKSKNEILKTVTRCINREFCRLQLLLGKETNPSPQESRTDSMTELQSLEEEYDETRKLLEEDPDEDD